MGPRLSRPDSNKPKDIRERSKSSPVLLKTLDEINFKKSSTVLTDLNRLQKQSDLIDKLKRSNSKSLSPTHLRKSVVIQSSRFDYRDSIENRRRMVLAPKTNQIYDDYIISRQVLGLGISGKVLCCTSKSNNNKYALKTLKESVKAKREIDLHWRACQGCPYIVQIIDVYENTINSQKVLLVVMELMEGGELFAKISERSTPFTEQEVAKIMHQICSAVKHLHSMNIAHRDLKPENLLLTNNDQNSIIKLTDFGFAKEVNLGLMTPCYTPYYVAPEILGSIKYDISCDIWSLGVIMYILCCGYPPFYSTHGQPISPGMKRRIKAGEYAFPENEWSRVSDDAKKLIKGMLETVPEKRITIEDIVRSKWISQYHAVPQTPLPSLDILKEDIDQWREVQDTMKKALDEMRINWDNKVKIKELPVANNPLLERRLKNKKTKTDGSQQHDASFLPPPPLPMQPIQEANDLSRESSMPSAKTTPTNSRPSSPTTKL